MSVNAVIWFGVFGNNGELWAVEESEEQAKAVAKHLAIAPNGEQRTPWPVKQVTISLFDDKDNQT
jgi:hypothetical protein